MRIFIFALLVSLAAPGYGDNEKKSDRLTFTQFAACAVVFGGIGAYVYWFPPKSDKGEVPFIQTPAPKVCEACKTAEMSVGALENFGSEDELRGRAEALAHHFIHTLPRAHAPADDRDDPLGLKLFEPVRLRLPLDFYASRVPAAAIAHRDGPEDAVELAYWAQTDEGRDKTRAALVGILEYESPLNGGLPIYHIQSVFSYATMRARLAAFSPAIVFVIEQSDRDPATLDAILRFAQKLPQTKAQSYGVYSYTKETTFPMARLKVAGYPFQFEADTIDGAYIARDKAMEQEGRYYAHSLYIPQFPPFPLERAGFQREVQFTRPPGEQIGFEEVREISLTRVKLGFILNHALHEAKKENPNLGDGQILENILGVRLPKPR